MLFQLIVSLSAVVPLITINLALLLVHSEIQFKVMFNSITAERRHNLLHVALATRHSNQHEIQQMQVLLTVPATRFPSFRQL